MIKVLSILVLCTACGPTPPPKPVPTPVPAAGDATCAEACTTAKKLRDANGAASGCKVADPTPKGATCEQVCQNALDEGIAWPTWCISQATSCDAIHNCQ